MKKIAKILMIIFLAIVITYMGAILICKTIFFPRKYNEIVNTASKTYNVDPNLIYAIIKQESKFNKDAVSHSNAKGLMQIIDSTAREMAHGINTVNENEYDIFDPHTNISIGTKYISYLIERFDGNYYLAIVAYNAGLGKVDEWTNKDYNKYMSYDTILQMIEYSETRNYFKNVINNYNVYVWLYE